MLFLMPNQQCQSTEGMNFSVLTAVYQLSIDICRCRAAAVGSIMFRAEVQGSTHSFQFNITCDRGKGSNRNDAVTLAWCFHPQQQGTKILAPTAKN